MQALPLPECICRYVPMAVIRDRFRRRFQLRQLHHVLGLRLVQFPLVVEQVHPAVEQGQEIHLVDPVADDRRLQGLLRLGDDPALVEFHQFPAAFHLGQGVVDGIRDAVLQAIQLFRGHGRLGRRFGHHGLAPFPLERQVEGDAKGIHVVAGIVPFVERLPGTCTRKRD